MLAPGSPVHHSPLHYSTSQSAHAREGLPTLFRRVRASLSAAARLFGGSAPRVPNARTPRAGIRHTYQNQVPTEDADGMFMICSKALLCGEPAGSIVIGRLSMLNSRVLFEALEHALLFSELTRNLPSSRTMLRALCVRFFPVKRNPSDQNSASRSRRQQSYFFLPYQHRRTN